REHRNFTHEEIDFFTTLGGQAAVAIQNARLFLEQEETNERLSHALRVQEEMIQNVSHELRTPLTLIQGYAEMLRTPDASFSAQEQAEFAEIIARGAQQLARMVNLLLAFQPPEQKQLLMERVDITELVQVAVATWQTRASEGGVRLLVSPAPEPLWVEGSSDELLEVLDNLLGNAVKFSPEGGEIAVRVWRAGDETYVAVSDQGIGLASDQLEKVFERFYQVDGSMTRRFGGIGLGLALCKEIVEAYGGRIWAESEGLGQGATFTFALPLA
ncbi:MAG TPA: HAMP domain-containing histidine kinase, partial [Anaerolineae bacterium]|nr:HAMP domain-containing histidine kinase [Anaerolineae bacterium]